MSHLVEVTDQTFDNEVFSSPLPVIVDFWGPWCVPCREMEPMLEEAATAFAGRLKVCKVDVSANHRIANNFSIMQVPTLIFFANGQPVLQTGKPRSKEALWEQIGDCVGVAR